MAEDEIRFLISLGLMNILIVIFFILISSDFRQSWRNSKFIDQMKKQELDKQKKKYPKDMIPRYKGDADE